MDTTFSFSQYFCALEMATLAVMFLVFLYIIFKIDISGKTRNVSSLGECDSVAPSNFSNERLVVSSDFFGVDVSVLQSKYSCLSPLLQKGVLLKDAIALFPDLYVSLPERVGAHLENLDKVTVDFTLAPYGFDDVCVRSDVKNFPDVFSAFSDKEVIFVDEVLDGGEELLGIKVSSSWKLYIVVCCSK